MLYLEINTIEGNPNKLYLYDYNYNTGTIDKSKVYSPDQVMEYAFDTSTNTLSAYNLLVWGRGAFCSKMKKHSYSYLIEGNYPFYFYAKKIDGLYSRDYGSEIFWDWAASRRNQDYYIYISIYSVSETKLQSFLKELFTIVNTKSVAYPRVIKLPSPKSIDSFKINDKLIKTEAFSREDILKLERIKEFRESKINWDLLFPEYEGPGDTIILLCSIATLVSPYVIEYIKRLRCKPYVINRCVKEINKTFDIKGELVPLSREESYDGNNNMIYRFNEVNHNRTVHKYKVIITPKNKYSAEIEE